MKLLRHRATLTTAGLAGLALVAVLGFRLFVYEPVAPPPPPARPPVRVAAIVESVQGPVERNLDGAWASLHEGDAVGAGTQVRTGKGARTNLRIDGKARVVLDEQSEVVVRELSDRIHHLRLLRGRMGVDNTAANAVPVRVEDESGAAAEARHSRFSVLSTGTTIAVATESGDVELTSARRTVHIAPGSQAVAQRGSAPAPAQPIAPRVLLRVANAVAGASATLCAELQGEVPAGAQLSIDGVDTPADPDGTFRVKVPRALHQRSVVVTLRDAQGRTKTREIPCAPSPAEIKDVAIRWGTSP